MALNDDDRKEVGKLIGEGITTAFGVPEGKTLVEHLAELTAGEANKALNGYDKRTSKSRTALEDSLKTLTETVATLKDGRGDDAGDDADDAGTGKGKSKLPPEVSKQIETLTKQVTDQAKQLETEKKARQESDAERKKAEDQATATRMRDEVQRLSLGKDVGVDPDRAEFMLDHLFGKQLVRSREDGKGYEFQSGTDKYSGDPVWKPLDEGLKEFVKGPGKMFLPAVPGAGGGAQVPPGSANRSGAQPFSADDLSKMKPAEVERAAAEGRLGLG